MLEQGVRQARTDAIDTGCPKIIDIAVEAVQRWIEYLDELELSDFRIDTEVTVQTKGKTIKFPGIDEVAEWITSTK